MLKIAIIALLIALVAGALGLGGVSGFAMNISQFFFSVWGLLLIAAIIVGVLAIRAFSRHAS